MAKRFFSAINSIKYKFSFTILACVLISTLINIYLWYTKTTSEVEESAKASVIQILKNSNNNFEVALKDINQIVTVVSVEKDSIIDVLATKTYDSEKDYLSDNRKVENFLLSLYSYKYYFSGMLVSSLEGRAFDTGTIMPFDLIEKQKWFEKLKDPSAGLIFVEPHYYSQWVPENRKGYKDMVISLAKPVLKDGKVVGVVVADVRCDILKDIFNINLKNDGTVMVVNKETGEFIFTPEKNGVFSDIDENVLPKISSKFTGKEGSFYFGKGNSRILVVYYNSSFTKWTTIGLMPMHMLTASFDRTRSTLLLMSVFFCIIIAGVALLMSSFLTKNILKMDKAIKGLGDETLDISLKIDSNDEIGHLYQQFNHMVKRIKGLIEDIKWKEKQKRKAEIKALQAQINPHFIYNTLNTIKFLATLQGVDNIRQVSESLSMLLHVNLDKGSSFISIEEEVSYLKCYLGIQEYKYSNKFTSEIIIEENIRNYMVLKLLLQPIVENALIHGISQVKRQGIIVIRVYKRNNCLMLRVQDNGAGMDESQTSKMLDFNEKSERIGLRNVQDRIKLYFGDDYGLTVISQKNVNTIIEASLPLITHEEIEKYV